MRFQAVAHTIGLGLAMYALWLLLSGHYDPLLLTLGVLSCLVIVVIAHRLDVIDHEAVPLHLGFGWFAYIGWLGREIVKSNLQVARVVLSPKLRVEPRMIRTRMQQRTEVGQVIYANSITLTPGTVSVEFEDDHIIVHAISAEAAEGLLSDEMNRRVAAIESR